MMRAGKGEALVETAGTSRTARFAVGGAALATALLIATAPGTPQAQVAGGCKNTVIPVRPSIDAETMLRVRDGAIFIKEDCSATLSYVVQMERGKKDKEYFQFARPDTVAIYVTLVDLNKNPFVAAFEVGRVPEIACNSFQEFTFTLDAGRFDRATVTKVSGGTFSFKKPEIMTPERCGG